MDNILGQLGEAAILLRADGSKLSDDLKKQRDQLGKQIDKIGKDLESVGKGLSIGVTAPIVAMGAAALAAGVKMDDALDAIRIQTGATGKALDGLTEDFKAVFADVPDDAQTVADTLSLLNTRLGLTGKGLQDLTGQILTMSRLTKTDVTANVDAATQSFAAWKIATQDQGEALDFVFKVSQNTGASVTDLMKTVTDNQATFKQLNYSFKDSVVLLGQLNKAGIDSSSAMMAMKMAIAKFADANIPARDGLEKTFNLIKQLGPGSQATALAIDVFGQKAGPQLAVAIQQGQLSVEQLRKTVDDSKETIKGAAQDTDGFAEKFQKFGNKMMLALEPLGTKLLDIAERGIPYLEKLGNIALGAADMFSKLPGPVQDTVIVLGGLAAATGPIMLVVGKFTNMKNVVNILRLTELPGLVRSITATNVALNSSTALMGLLGLGAISLGTGIMIAKRDMDKYLESVQHQNELNSYQIKLTQKVGESWDDYIARVKKANELWSGAGGTVADLTGGVVDLSQELGVSSGKAEAAAGAVHGVAGEAENFSNQLTNNKQKLEDLAKANEVLAALQKGVTDSTKDSILALTAQGLGVDQVAAKLGLYKEVVDAVITKEQERIALEQEAWKDRLSEHDQEVQNADQLMDKFFKNLDMQTSAEREASNIRAKLTESDYDYQRQQIAQWVDDQTKDLDRSVDGWQNTYNAIVDLGQAKYEELAAEQSQAVMKMAVEAKSQMLDAWGDIFRGIPKLMQDALVGGGGLKGFGKALTNQITTQIGNSLIDNNLISKGLGKIADGLFDHVSKGVGKLFGELIPGLGGVIGPLIGKGITALGNAFGKLFGNKAMTGRQDFAKQMGFDNLDSLYADLQNLGDKGAALANIGLNVIGRNDEEGNRKWMDDVKAFYDEIAEKKQKAADDAAQQAQDESDARDKLQAAIEKYGFTIDEMGPKWRQQQLTEQAQGLIEDFTVLTASGIDANVVLTKMGGSIQDFVSMALKTGSEVPEAMRPMLQQMVDMGTLTDENGNKITDLGSSGIKFSMTLSEGFQKVVDKLDVLIRKITGDLTDGLNDIPSPTVDVDVNYRYHDEGMPDDGSSRSTGSGEYQPPNPQYQDQGEYPSFADGGIANFGSGTLSVLHGMEAVVPIEKLGDLMSNMSPGLDPQDLVQAMKAAGLDRPNITVAPKIEGALASEMYSFADYLVPLLIRVLQDNGSYKTSFAGTLGVQ